MKRQKKKLIGLLIFLVAFFAGIFVLRYGGYRSVSVDSQDAGELKVHFIDVGQGNAVLLELNGRFILIDGGDADAIGKLTGYLDEEGVKKLDYLVATHYDIDHLYGLIGVLYEYDVDQVLAPDYKVDTKTYHSFMAGLSVKKKGFRQPQVGEEIAFGDAVLLCVAPGDTKFQNENDYSIGFKILYGNTSFLLCGDATYRSEIEMLESGIDLKSDVYLVSHHGSSSSSTTEFLEAVHPKISIISVGADNSYGHPTKKVLKRLQNVGTDVYRTDERGDIIVKSDGEHLTVNCQGKVYESRAVAANEADGKNTRYVVNTNSGKIHLESCDSVREISESNKLFYEGTKKQLQDMGYTPCKKCMP